MNFNPTAPPVDERPLTNGLYNPCFEHDACGVGMVCDISGTASHQIVSQGIEILLNLSHRGASGCDAETGDGAGIMIQMPDDFLRRVCRDEGFELPAPGAYAAGLVFLSKDVGQQQVSKAIIEKFIAQEGQQLLGWRRMPVCSDALGHLSRHAEPFIEQVFIGQGEGTENQDHFERKLYVIRKQVEITLLRQKLPCHLPSLSSRTFVYKGMFLAHQLQGYYPDLKDPALQSALALVHQRYSTNTFPAWDLAQPFRLLCHNGEINTLRGNLKWLAAREPIMSSRLLGRDLAKILPIATPGASDSAGLDAVLELLYHSGRSLPHGMMMMIPEAFQQNSHMSIAKKQFYEYHAALMEPWDGPACVPFTDGRWIGAVLDRNGLRPCRYTLTHDGLAVLASETGVLDIAPERVKLKGRLEPGRMFLVDLQTGCLVEDEQIKTEISARRPYGLWVQKKRDFLDRALQNARDGLGKDPLKGDALQQLQQLFGYTREDLKILLAPMASKGKEPAGSMGDDTPPAILSRRPRLLYDYFRQLFAQVTNPPLDAIRESLVTSLTLYIGPEHNLLAETPEHSRRLMLTSPVLTDDQMAAIRNAADPFFQTADLEMCFLAAAGTMGLVQGMIDLCEKAVQAVENGAELLILSDRAGDEKNAPIPALLAVAGVHQHLIRMGLRTKCDLVVESAEPREVHHFCCLLGYGAGAVHPYLALDTIKDLVANGHMNDVTIDQALSNYRHALEAGILKVMSKMGISTLQSYRGAQMFECIGLSTDVVQQYFTHTLSRIGGAGLDLIARETLMRHEQAVNSRAYPEQAGLPSGGRYQWRRNGEQHQYNPGMLALFRQAVFDTDDQAWQQFTEQVNAQNRQEGLLRGWIGFKTNGPAIPLESVEPWTEIVKRFKTGAMSYGSISKEAHETLAIAMNRLGARSNSGEGGEDPDRFHPDENGDWRNSTIKQVASGRFGVTGHYLVNARELQIKMAQGAKPGEGGQLPGFKVYPWIAATRHSTPYVGLISPPPHHDIYSIEDLSQLIHDLKCANPRARISVKLVSTGGVGTIAAGVAKGGADIVLISGETGGTGASPVGSIRHCGMPWELGLTEAHQTLMVNGLRDRVILECDGQLKTGHDVAVACLMGAQEFGFGTLALVALGCIMMRVCHLNTCPVGIATQDPELRKKFAGKPDHVIALMRLLAEDLRRIMARLGFRTVNDMVGQTHRLDFSPAIDHWKARGLDLSPILKPVDVPAHVAVHCAGPLNPPPEDEFDAELMARAAPAVTQGQPIQIDLNLRNIYRTVGTRLSSAISSRYGDKGLPEDTLRLECRGSAGQSFLAFGAPGITAIIQGDANDYFGKGLSGAKLILTPPRNTTYNAEDQVIVGNAALYGATRGHVFIRGRAGERFCVRNSGAQAVVEGTGDHACEYMTGGRVVILGPTGRNTAAGMSGGVAYVLDQNRDFQRLRCNREMVDLEPVTAEADLVALRTLIEKHVHHTDSRIGKQVLDQWERMQSRFIKIMPREYKQALARLAGQS